jgi:hypothetical protein
MSPVKRIPLSADHETRSAWSAVDAEPYREEPVHHDWKRVYKLANIIADVPVELAPVANSRRRPSPS